MKRSIYSILAFLLALSAIIFWPNYSLSRQDDLLEEPTQIQFSHPSGEYEEAINLRIKTGCENANIAISLDGSEPDFDNQQKLELPILLDNESPVVTVIKAKAQCPTHPPTETIQGSYIQSIPHQNPIVSLIVDPNDLYDSQIGLLAGENYLEKGREWERNAYITLVDENDTLDFSGGIRIHGKLTRTQTKKSFRVYLRSEYGMKYLNYPLLGENLTPERYKRFVLSNGGQDNSGLGDQHWSPNWTLIRTQIINNLANEISLPTTNARPVNLFINGEPQGLYIARNYLSNHFYRDKYGYDDVKEMEPYLEDENSDWEDLNKLFKTQDFSKDEAVDLLAQEINLDQLIDYYIMQMYIANLDWIFNNFNMFRAKSMVDGSEPDKRWQFMLWDVEYGFGGGPSLSGITNLNMFESLEKERDESEFYFGRKLIQALFENENFRLQFIDRMDYLLSTTLSTENVSLHITNEADLVRPDIDSEILRWGATASWEKNIDYLYRFAQERPENMRLHADAWLKQK